MAQQVILTLLLICFDTICYEADNPQEVNNIMNELKIEFMEDMIYE